MRVVVSQPMLFPWVGMLEQVRLADVYVNYSDVQFSKGSFVNRVQIKLPSGAAWMTVPLEGLRLGQRINEVCINQRADWQSRHLETLRQAYSRAPFREEMLSLVRSVYQHAFRTIDLLSEASLRATCEYFELDHDCRFVSIDALRTSGASSKRVLDTVLAVGGDVYLTGLGARRYLDHCLFEDAGVRVEYMKYLKVPYPQLHGAFVPYVSSLDLVANMGKQGASVIRSTGTYWRDFLAHE